MPQRPYSNPKPRPSTPQTPPTRPSSRPSARPTPRPNPRPAPPFSSSSRRSSIPFLQITKYIGIALLVILVGMVLVKLAMVIATGFQPFVNSVIAISNDLFSRFISALIGAAILSCLAYFFLSNLLPLFLRNKIFPLATIVVFIYTFIPSLGTALGELLTMLFGIAILLNLLKRR